MPKIKITQIVKGIDIGGANGGSDKFAIDLSEQLIKDGYDVDFCVFYRMYTEAEQKWLNLLREKGVEPYFSTNWSPKNKYIGFIQGTKNLLIHLKKTNPSIIHSHCHLGAYVSMIYKMQAKNALILRTAHNVREWGTGEKEEVKKQISNCLYANKLDLEVGVSEAVVNQLKINHGNKTLKNPLKLIHNGMSLAGFERGNSTGKRGTEKFVIGTVGRLTEQKGYKLLIDSMPGVLQQYPETKLVILGDGELRSELENRIQELELASHIELAGQVNNVQERLKEFDLFVSSSLWEGLPTVLMEAMASGLPVIATDIPGTKELITNRWNGMLVQPNNITELSNGLIELISNSVLREKIIENAFQFVGQYSIDRIAEEYGTMYQFLLNEINNDW